MLTLDHINDEGAIHRRQIGGGGSVMYTRVKKEGFPSGFQTLCANHQTKKELRRKRQKALATYEAQIA
jgi:hypothetical protein